jgi:hypothetical protein
MSNDKRITIRLSADLHAWVEQEAAKLALDSAAFVRMSLQQRKNGHVAQTPLLDRPAESAMQPADIGGSGDDHGAPDAAPNPDDLVRQALETAERTGLANPQAPEDEYPEFGGSVRPVGPRKTWDPYNAKERARA